jgi:hypothetical protein
MKRSTREWTVEEFDAWSKSTDKYEAVAEAADEEGGPRLSLVPVAEREIAWPTDLLPPAVEPAPGDSPEAPESAPAAPPVLAEPFDGVPLKDSRKRWAGWSAERQRLFLTNLAETGSVHLACAAARISARSAPARRPSPRASSRPAARGRAALGIGLRSRHPRPHRAGLARRRARRRETGAQRQAPYVVARPARSAPLRRAVGAAQGRSGRSPGGGAPGLPGPARRARGCGRTIGSAPAMASATIGDHSRAAGVSFRCRSGPAPPRPRRRRVVRSRRTPSKRSRPRRAWYPPRS